MSVDWRLLGRTRLWEKALASPRGGEAIQNSYFHFTAASQSSVTTVQHGRLEVCVSLESLFWQKFVFLARLEVLMCLCIFNSCLCQEGWFLAKLQLNHGLNWIQNERSMCVIVRHDWNVCKIILFCFFQTASLRVLLCWNTQFWKSKMSVFNIGAINCTATSLDSQIEGKKMV